MIGGVYCPHFIYDPALHLQDRKWGIIGSIQDDITGYTITLCILFFLYLKPYSGIRIIIITIYSIYYILRPGYLSSTPVTLYSIYTSLSPLGLPSDTSHASRPILLASCRCAFPRDSRNQSFMTGPTHLARTARLLLVWKFLHPNVIGSVRSRPSIHYPLRT